MELDITIADSTTFYRPVLELFNDGKRIKIRKLLMKFEKCCQMMKRIVIKLKHGLIIR